MFIQYLQTTCVLPVDLPMDKKFSSSIFLARNIYTTRRNFGWFRTFIIYWGREADSPDVCRLTFTRHWCETQIKSTERFLFSFCLVFFLATAYSYGWHLWTCCINACINCIEKCRDHYIGWWTLHRLMDVFIFGVTLNIF